MFMYTNEGVTMYTVIMYTQIYNIHTAKLGKILESFECAYTTNMYMYKDILLDVIADDASVMSTTYAQ